MTTTSAVTRVLGRDTPTERMTQEPHEWSPLVLLAPVALALVALGLAAAGRDGFSAREVVGAPLAAAWILAGGVVVVRPGLRRLGALLLGAGGLAGVTYLACCVATTQDPGGTRDIALLVRSLGIGLLPSTALLFLLALPAGRLGTSTRRTTALIGGLVGLGVGLFIWTERPDVPAEIIWIWSLVAVGMGLPAANQRYLQASGMERQRLQWMGCAAAVSVEIALVVATLRLFADWPHRAGLVAAAGTLLIPAGIALGAWRRLAARADRLLVHTVSLTGLTAVVVAVYLLIVVGLGRVPTDTERQLLVLSMAAAGVSAIVYSPTRDRLREVANRLVYGEREPPDAVLRTFGSRLSRAVPMDELLLQLVESLRKTMTLRAAEVWTGADGRLDRAVSVPERPPAWVQLDETQLPVVARAGVSGNAWAAVWLSGVLEAREDSLMRVVPVAHSGELLGLIVAERPADGELFAAEEDRVLTELARQVGLALHNVELDSALQQSLEELRHTAEELRVSRARIVATADAERRKIERDLHDGAQQHLVALAVNLRLLKDVMGDDPAMAAEMVDQLADSVKETVQELRDLAHGIYPPLLVDKGLSEALRAAAGRSPLDVRVETDVGRYPPEVEAAIYFCCLEALQNAGKHAPEATVEVRVNQTDGVLEFRVADDGPGFNVATATAGHGYVNMSDRLGAIGGTVQWESQPGEGSVISGGAVPVSDNGSDGGQDAAQSKEPSAS